MRNEYKKGRITVEGRTFLLEFWKDDYLNLPYVAASEITIEERKPHWWSHKKRTYGGHTPYRKRVDNR